MYIFNNREIAIGIWIIIFIIYLLVNRSTRKSVGGLLSAVFAWKLTVIYLSSIAYVVTIVYLLFRLRAWDTLQLKDTILWMLTVGFVSLFDITREDKTNYFKDAAKKILRFTTILEFIVGFYSFNLFLELLIVPVVILISGLLVVGKKDAKFKPVRKLLNTILSVIGLVLIGYTAYKIIHSFNSFANKETLGEFLIPPVLSFLFLPFVYILSLLVNLESIFTGIRSELKRERLMRFAQWQVFLQFNFNKTDMNRWRQLMSARHPVTKRDILESIKLIKRLKKIEKNPPLVPTELGWSPYRAKDFLALQGIITKFYQPTYSDEWGASSTAVDLKDSILSSNVYYFIDGDGTAAKKMILEMNVFSHEGAKIAHAKFLNLAKILYMAAMSKPLPDGMEEAILKGTNKIIEAGNKKTSIHKNKWTGHKLNGYEMEFMIQVF